MAFNEQALKYIREAEAGQISEESEKWNEDNIYHGSEDLYYACTDGVTADPSDIYDELEAKAVRAALEIVEGFISDYYRFRGDY